MRLPPWLSLSRLQLWLGILLLGGLGAILAITDRAPGADGPHMLAQGLRLGSMLREGDFSAFSDIWRLSGPHPPFGYLPLVVLGTVGVPLHPLIALTAVFWLWLAWDAFKRLAGPLGTVGWLAALSSGLTWWAADSASFDLATAATCLQAISWLQASEGFTQRRASLAFGFWLGAAFLTKYSSPLILFLPVLFSSLSLIRPSRARFKHLALALAVWALVAGIWMLDNQQAVIRYVGSALNPPPGPGNFPMHRTLLERFAGEGQLLFLAVLKDALGWPLLGLLALGSLFGRRLYPLLGVFSGVIFLGAMNSREGRYALPMVFLLAAAGLPRPREAGGPRTAPSAEGGATETDPATTERGHPSPILRAVQLGWLGLLGLVSLPGLLTAGWTYHQARADQTPNRRTLRHSPETFAHLEPWPAPAVPFLPLAEQPEAYQVLPVLKLARGWLQPGESLGILVEGLPQAPGSSTYQLQAEQARLKLDLTTILVRVGPQGVETVRYRGPLAAQGPVGARGPKDPQTLKKAGVGVRLVYVVTHPSQPGGLRWLEQTPHRVLKTWPLPEAQTGQLVALEEAGPGGPGQPPNMGPPLPGQPPGMGPPLPGQPPGMGPPIPGLIHQPPPEEKTPELPEIPGQGPVFVWPPPRDSGPAQRFAARTGRKVSVEEKGGLPLEVSRLVSVPGWRLRDLQAWLRRQGWERLYVNGAATYGQASELAWLVGSGEVARDWPDVQLQAYTGHPGTAVPPLPMDAGQWQPARAEDVEPGLGGLLDRSLASRARVQVTLWTSDDGRYWREEGWVAHSLSSLGLSLGEEGTLQVSGMLSLDMGLQGLIGQDHSSSAYLLTTRDLKQWGLRRLWLADRLAVVDPQLSQVEGEPVLTAWARTGPLGVDPVALTGDHPVFQARRGKDGLFHAGPPVASLPFLADPSPAGKLLFATVFPGRGQPRVWIGAPSEGGYQEVASLPGLTVPYVWQDGPTWRLVAHGPGPGGPAVVRATSRDGLKWSVPEVVPGLEEVSRCESPVEGRFQGRYVLICSQRLKGQGS